MPVAITRNKDGDGILLRANGVLTGAELVEENRRFFDVALAPGGDFGCYRFWFSDYSAARLNDVQAEHMQVLGGIALRAATVNPSLLVAILAPDNYPFGMARMWTALSDETGWPVEVCRQRDDAAHWLAQRLGGAVSLD